MIQAVDNPGSAALYDDATVAIAQARRPAVEPISTWVESRIVCPPTSPHRGELYRHANHPVSRLWFEALDRGGYWRRAATAPSQNGKTFMCYTLPTVHQLFEAGESVIIGLPSMDLANDKWQDDFLPVIRSSFPDMLPRTGEGSRGGKVKSAVRFANGSELRFMTSGGGDKSRAGKTTRFLAVTEVDGMDTAGTGSREADPVSQLEARMLAHVAKGTARTLLECTVSTEAGRIWQEITSGTFSQVWYDCPLCGAPIRPEREHLAGWADAENEIEAGEAAAFVCPTCAGRIGEVDRRRAWKSGRLAARTQSVEGGRVIGEPPRTDTFSIRWSAFDNPFMTIDLLGRQEWKAARAQYRENAEKETRQFFWAIPYEPPEIAITPLEADDVVKRRAVGFTRGVVPDAAIGVTVGIDTGKRQLDWVAIAIGLQRCWVIEYGEQPVQWQIMKTDAAILAALNELHGYFSKSWRNESGCIVPPSQVWTDSGYHKHKEPVYQFCRNRAKEVEPGHEIYRPTKGHGERQQMMTPYRAPTKKSNDVRYIGNNFHMNRQREARLNLVHVNSDYWKSEVHERLAIPADQVGALVLYDAPSINEHDDYADEITAEEQQEEFIPGRGEIKTWNRIRRKNHKLDASYSGIAAGWFLATEYVRAMGAQGNSGAGWFERQAG